MILACALEFACMCWVGFNPENPGLASHCPHNRQFGLFSFLRARAVARQTGWQGPKEAMLVVHLPQAYLTHLNGWQGQGG
jgi:hypothetical protein